MFIVGSRLHTPLGQSFARVSRIDMAPSKKDVERAEAEQQQIEDELRAEAKKVPRQEQRVWELRTDRSRLQGEPGGGITHRR